MDCPEVVHGGYGEADGKCRSKHRIPDDLAAGNADHRRSDMSDNYCPGLRQGTVRNREQQHG